MLRVHGAVSGACGSYVRSDVTANVGLGLRVMEGLQSRRQVTKSLPVLRKTPNLRIPSLESLLTDTGNPNAKPLSKKP